MGRMSVEMVRITAVIIALLLVAAAAFWRERFVRTLRSFWLEPTSPVNLALPRIVLFYLLLRSAIGQNPVWYARMFSRV
jgi:hypothetical protein